MTTDMPPTEAEILAARAKNMSVVRYRAWMAEAKGDEKKLPDLAPSGALCGEIALLFPFHMTCPDNDKFGVINGVMINTKRYRRAKKAMRESAREQYVGPLLLGPLALVARVWFPGEDGDAPNLQKCAHDALEKVIYRNDKQLHDARWIRAGVDAERPRVEITITAVTA